MSKKLRSLSSALKKHVNGYAVCPNCREVFRDDLIAYFGSVFCPNQKTCDGQIILRGVSTLEEAQSKFPAGRIKRQPAIIDSPMEP
jgi:hypothetical protein